MKLYEINWKKNGRACHVEIEAESEAMALQTLAFYLDEGWDEVSVALLEAVKKAA